MINGKEIKYFRYPYAKNTYITSKYNNEGCKGCTHSNKPRFTYPCYMCKREKTDLYTTKDYSSTG